ncbi:hypothetical protein SDIAM103S_05592 [Streptomyces diastaticus subsp. diastaticus]
MTVASSRTGGAPRQECGPSPSERCRGPVRVKRSGRRPARAWRGPGPRWSTRRAPAYPRPHPLLEAEAPGGVAEGEGADGAVPAQELLDGLAPGGMPAQDEASWSRREHRARTALVTRWRVVPSLATTRRNRGPSSSAGASRPPPSSRAVVNALVRSPPGAAARVSATSPSSTSRARCALRVSPGSAPVATTRSDRADRRSWWAGSTPRSSPMTAIGRGSANRRRGSAALRHRLCLVEQGVGRRDDARARRLDSGQSEGGGDRHAQPAATGVVRGGHTGHGGEGPQRPAVGEAPLAQVGEAAGPLATSGRARKAPRILVSEKGHTRDLPRRHDPRHQPPGRAARRCPRADTLRRVSSGAPRQPGPGPCADVGPPASGASRPAGRRPDRPRVCPAADGGGGPAPRARPATSAGPAAPRGRTAARPAPSGNRAGRDGASPRTVSS